MLTPLTIPRRNWKTLIFNGPFLQLSTSVISSLFSSQFNMPYPGWSLMTGADNDDRYDIQCIKADGISYGKFFPFALNGTVVTNVNISSDGLTAIIVHGVASGAAGFDYSVIALTFGSVTIGPPKIPPTGTIIPPVGYLTPTSFSDSYVFGVGCLCADVVTNLDYQTCDLTGVFLDAFTPDTDIGIGNINVLQTLNDGIFNYTLIIAFAPDVLTSIMSMSKWQAGGIFTNYSLHLNISDDDAIFQASILVGFDVNHYQLVKANQANFQYVFGDNNATTLTEQTCFIFANDFSWYDRIDIVSDGTIESGAYFQDIDGNDFLIGVNSTETLFQVGPQVIDNLAPSLPPISGMRISDIYTLPCWHPCVPHAKKGPAFV